MGASDIAAKVVLGHCQHAALDFFLGLDVQEASLLDLPQETATLRRTDFPIQILDSQGRSRIVLLEFQVEWRANLPLRLLEYDCRHQLHHGLPVLPVILLLRGGATVDSVYQTERLRYRFELIRLGGLDAADLLAYGNPCLMPFIPLMRNGLKVFDQAESEIYASNLDRETKGDLLTGMAVFAGLISRELPKLLLQRRKDIMIESAAYELIRNEGFTEGMQQGVQQGMLLDAQEMVLDAITERYGFCPTSLEKSLRGIQSRHLLRNLQRQVLRQESFDEFKDMARKMMAEG